MRQSRAASLSVFAFGFAVGMVLLCWPRPLGAQAAPASTPMDVVIQHDVPLKTRDGVTLYADIYRPKSAGGKCPVILMRTPYDKSVGWAVSPVFKIVPRGYVVVIQ